MKAGLLTNTFIDVQEVIQEKISYSSHVLSEDDLDMISVSSSTSRCYFPF
jgi:hypothetical protein